MSSGAEAAQARTGPIAALRRETQLIEEAQEEVFGASRS